MKLEISTHQAFDAQGAVDTATLNAVVYIAMLLRRHQVVTAEEVEHLHTVMSRPLNLGINATNPLVQKTLQHLDEQFATILNLP